MSTKISFIMIDDSESLLNVIVQALIEAGLVPDYEQCGVVHLIECLRSNHEPDFVIINHDSQLLSLDNIQHISQKLISGSLILISDQIDDFDKSLYIKSGCDYILSPSRLDLIANLMKKHLSLYKRTNPFKSRAELFFFDEKISLRNIDTDLHSISIRQEIEELIENESRLRETHAFFNTILENIPNLIYVKDVENLRFMYLNKASEKMTGYLPSELIGKNVFELFSKDYAEYYNSKDIELLESNQPVEVSEEMILTKDNKLKIFYTKKLLINDATGKPKYLLGISEDMTSHYKAQEELRKSELRFSKIFHSSPVAIFVVAVDKHIIVDANSRMLELIGHTREEMIGKPIEAFPQVFKEDGYSMLVSALEGSDSFINKEINLSTKNGEQATLLLSLEMMEFTGESWGIFMGLDISERKLAEVETSTALERQKELNTLKTQFISMISHEFRTPLTTIMLSTDLLSRYSDKWSKEESSKHFARIKDTILKMTQLMENVLIIGRIDSGKFFFNPESLDLEAFCFSLARNLEFSQSGTHKVNLQFNGDCSTSKVDENLLGLVINNLLSNAIKYSPNANKVDFIVNCNGRSAEFIIRDYGIGIPEDDLNHLFQSFFRAGNVGPIPGYGLGLSIVKKCVDAHNGKIEVMSRAGEGTTFVVTVPIV